MYANNKIKCGQQRKTLRFAEGFTNRSIGIDLFNKDQQRLLSSLCCFPFCCFLCCSLVCCFPFFNGHANHLLFCSNVSLFGGLI